MLKIKSNNLKRNLTNLVAIIICYSPLNFAYQHNGDDVYNGESIIDLTVKYAYLKLENLSKLCLKARTCDLNQSEESLLEIIISTLPVEQVNENQITILSSKDRPELFLIDNEMKVAVTGSYVSSPIFLNRELLYKKNETNLNLIPLSLAEIAGILIHEMGHHHGNFSESELDGLAAKITMFLNRHIEMLPQLPRQKELSGLLVNSDNKNGFPEFILSSGEDFISLASELKDEFYCPAESIFKRRGKKPISVFLFNLHWSNNGQLNSEGKYSLIGNLILNCENAQKNIEIINDYKIFISFKLKDYSNMQSAVIDKSSIYSEEFYEPRWKLF